MFFPAALPNPPLFSLALVHVAIYYLDTCNRLARPECLSPRVMAVFDFVYRKRSAVSFVRGGRLDPSGSHEKSEENFLHCCNKNKQCVTHHRQGRQGLSGLGNTTTLIRFIYLFSRPAWPLRLSRQGVP